MTTSALSPVVPGTSGSDDRPRLRVQLARMFGNSPVDGAWWPHSRTLGDEAPHLIEDFPPLRGRIASVAYASGDWDDAPSTVTTPHGQVELSTSLDDASVEPHLVLLTMSSGRVLRLLVVPSSVEQGKAIPIMTRAAASGNNEEPSTLLGS